MVSFDDGNGPGLFAAGDFARAGDTGDVRSIAVWRGGSWSAVGPGFTDSRGNQGTVNSLVVFDEGNGPALFACGNFASAGDTVVASIAKWNGIQWSPLGAGIPQFPRSMVVFDDGRGPALFVAGYFRDPAGRLSGSAVAKWNGQAWARIAGGTPRGDWYNYQPCPIGWFCPVFERPEGDALGVFDAGRGEALFLSGNFKGPHRLPLGSPAQWNGRRWTNLRGGSVSGRIDTFTTHDDGTGPALYAGGYITAAGGVEAIGIARWDGRRWSVLGAGVQGGLVSALLSFDDGSGSSLFVGGGFESTGGQPTNNIARWKCRDEPD
jgi:hypothetical protein